MAKDDVTKAYNKALLAKNVSENARADLAALLDEITDFLTAGGARAQEIRQVSRVFFVCLFVCHSYSD